MPDAACYILFVDDDDDDQQLLQECSRWLGVAERAYFLSSGEAVFRFLSTLRNPEDYPALIVLDVNMPGMGGGETLLRLKRHPLYRHIPVVIHSTADHDPSQYLAMGADAFCPKASSYAQWQCNVASFFRRVSLLPGP